MKRVSLAFLIAGLALVATGAAPKFKNSIRAESVQFVEAGGISAKGKAALEDKLFANERMARMYKGVFPEGRMYFEAREQAFREAREMVEAAK